MMFSPSISTHTGDYGRSTVASHIKAALNVLYTKKHIQTYTSYPHQLYYFKERGVDLVVEGVRYIEMHRGSIYK